jgi:hypothetical protein
VDELEYQPGASELVDELHSLSKEELIRRHDLCIKLTRDNPWSMKARQPYLNQAQTYLAEITRRENVEQGERMQSLTASIKWLTWVITGATVIGVLLTAYAMFFA